MRLTSFTDFGLRALMLLAAAPDRSATTAELAEELQISRNHLAKIVQALVRAGYLVTRRGGGGGILLARPPENIRLGDVVRTLERGHRSVECLAKPGSGCVLLGRCAIRHRLRAAEEVFLAELNRATLAEVALRPAGQPAVKECA